MTFSIIEAKMKKSIASTGALHVFTRGVPKTRHAPNRIIERAFRHFLQKLIEVSGKE